MTYRRITDISFSEKDQSEGDGESSLNLQSAGAFSISGSKWAGSEENTVDDDMKQYARIQIFTPEIFFDFASSNIAPKVPNWHTDETMPNWISSFEVDPSYKALSQDPD